MLRFTQLALVAATLVPGCLREPTFTYRDGGAGGDGALADGGPPDASGTAAGDLTVTEVAGAITVTGGHFQLTFAANNYQMPIGLDMAGFEMLGAGRACNDEQGIGIGLFPALGINGHNAFGRMNVTREVTLAGPAVVQILVNSAATYTCGGTEETLGTRATFTIFADGRIARRDVLQTSAASGTPCSTCVGETADPTFYLTGYTTLRGDGAGLDNDFGPPGPAYGASVNAASSVCLERTGRLVAVAWPSSARNHRVRVVETAPRTLAFVEDLQTTTMLPAGDGLHQSTMLLRRGASCVGMRNQAESFYEVRDLRVMTSTGPTSIGIGTDGIYGSPPSGPFDPPVGPVTLTPANVAIPGAWAMWFEFAQQPTNQITATHTDPAKQDGVRLQRVEGTNQFLVVVRDPLAVGEAVTITPQ